MASVEHRFVPVGVTHGHTGAANARQVTWKLSHWLLASVTGVCQGVAH